MYNKEDLLLFVKQSKRHSHIYNNRDKLFDDMIHITIEYHYVPRSNVLQKVISYLYNMIFCYVISYSRREKLVVYHQSNYVLSLIRTQVLVQDKIT